ncbi:hypothetical protein BJX68DRAFT_268052 [Aspergillus pseudodeflectus]|uniref:Uncharacterized protein n=1 Tax=Aspergillus pseudodeflectus TaxID=176178 RepID=A0ABR4K5S7_9EURO
MASIAAKTSIFETTSPLTGNPSSLVQWKQTLQEIKLLYMQRQYKRCVARSSSIFSSAREPIHPVHKIFLYFYTAICYEAMGRYAHDYSRNKIPLLQSALDCFVTCLGVLRDDITVLEKLSVGKDTKPGILGSEAKINPSEEIREDNSMAQDAFKLQAEIESFSVSFTSTGIASLSPSPSPLSSAASRSTSPTESIVSSITDIIDKTLGCPEDDPFLSDSDSDNPNYSGKVNNFGDSVGDGKPLLSGSDSPENEPRLMPSPLYVRKSAAQPRPLVLPSLDTENRNGASKDKARDRVKRSSRPPPIPLPIKLGVDPETNKSLKKRSSYGYSFPGLNPTSRPLPTPPAPPSDTASSAQRHSSTLTFLNTQITSSIASLNKALKSTAALQHSRAMLRRNRGLRRSVSFWSFSPVKHGHAVGSSEGLSSPCNEQSPSESPSALLLKNRSTPEVSSSSSAVRHGHESVQDRIARLRAEGWETIGLKNPTRGWKGTEYYQSFCGAVLNELYLDA